MHISAKKPIVSLYKPVGMTPYQAILQLKEKHPQYKHKKIGYAGRLDPMAEGVLLLLIDEENKKRKIYERLPKEYEFEVLLGIETDTYDVLGIVNKTHEVTKTKQLEQHIAHIVSSFEGTWDQPYPPYSSARVRGKPLFYWAREGKIDDIPIPSKSITVDTITVQDIEEIKLGCIDEVINHRIELVTGKFRQKEILRRWSDIFSGQKDTHMVRVSCFIQCSSGTYVRSLAHELGGKLGIGGIALSIKRTKVGPYHSQNALQITSDSK